MARYCNLCRKAFPTSRRFASHNGRVHKHPKPLREHPSTFRFHPHLNARPCDEHGNFLPPGALPPLVDGEDAWDPFEDRPSFEFAELLFEKIHASAGDMNQLLRILAAKRTLRSGGHETTSEFFDNHAAMVDTIDSISFDGAEWSTYRIRYVGPAEPDAPWKHEVYMLHTRDIQQTLLAMARNPEFDGRWDYTPFEEFISENNRRLSNLMSGRFAWKQADKLAEDANTHGAMLLPVVLGADKTTVSVATGHQEYHPLYTSAGNIDNSMRRAHGQGVDPVAFLPIPKTAREYASTEEFRVFKKQLYHAAIARVIEPLRDAITTYTVIMCPDGHYRRVIFELGPFIADYPEQVYVAGIVQGWCPKCRALPDELERAGPPRFREHTERTMEGFDTNTLWDVFGLVGDVVPFTYRFPRADIHELITPDILHQLIKGTFKDHLVQWVEDYVYLTADTAAEAKRIMDDIDRRIATAPSFPGLRRFPEGRNFSQWTGNDSKALMKVFIPAIAGYVPDAVVQCITSLLDFCYLARRNTHDRTTLASMDAALERFHALRPIFEQVGVRPNGFSLPRQHALVHYVPSIRLFGSPNGLCSSITESKHITAVKIPWRSSSRYNAIDQIVTHNVRQSKLAAARSEYGRRGMLQDNVYDHALLAMDVDIDHRTQVDLDARFRDEQEAAEAGGVRADARVELSARPAYVRRLHLLAVEHNIQRLREWMCRFLHDHLYPELDAADAIPLNQCPQVPPEMRISVFQHATAIFYAPSEDSGPGGMHREIIRCNPSWYNRYVRFDTVLVNLDPTLLGLRGMLVARVRLFFKFIFEDVEYPCAFVEWFEPVGEDPDPSTGMWIVQPEVVNGERVVGVIHVDSIVRACHLMPVFGQTVMPLNFDFSDTLDAFNCFYVNHYIDYHAHETLKAIDL